MCNVVCVLCRHCLLFCAGKQASLRVEELLLNSPYKYMQQFENK